MHVVIERHGHPVAAIVSIEDLARLEGERPTGGRPAGALALVGAWADLDDTAIDAFLADVASTRQRDTGRSAIGDVDMRVASIALARGMVVLTANTRRFARVAGLTVENWLA